MLPEPATPLSASRSLMQAARSRLRGPAVFLSIALAFVLSAPVLAADVVITGHALSDNGDNDGYADTNEIVNMQITVWNASGSPLTGVTARLEADDPKIECLTQHMVYIGDLAAGETRFIPGAFAFKVGDVNRTDPYEEFTAAFRVVMSTATAGELDVIPEVLLLELDLDATPGSGPQDYFEGFEAGSFGTLTTMNLDAGKSSLEASDGYRCQYSDPDWPASNSYGEISDCWLGASELHADAFFWHVTDGDPGAVLPDRSYSGRYSVHMGIWDESTADWTTPLAALEGLGSGLPVNLGSGRVCETTRTIACTEDTDCPPGESCAGVAPELSFKHQVDFADWRTVGGDYPLRSILGAAVAVQFADEAGAAVGDWVKLYAYTNVYDQQLEDNYPNCFFDPIDDGNTEDDFFDPADPQRRLGPATLCYPAPVFGYLGDTDAPFDPNEIGNANDGPGLAGATGLGTWVESRFNLQRFRGRRIRIRFISSGIKAGPFETYEDLFKWNPIAGDDGWWIDDIRITDTLAVPAVLSVDTKDNGGLPGVTDADGDRYCDSDCDDGDPDCTIDCSDADSDGQRICNGDCDEANPVIYLGAEEVCDGFSNDCAHPYWPLVDYWTPASVAEPTERPVALVAADLDGDGDADAVTASYVYDTIAWHENLSGDGSDWATHTISTARNGPRDIFAADIDGDEDTDVVSASSGDGRLYWHDNTAGDGSAWTEVLIAMNVDVLGHVMAADMDGDGDMDVVAAASDVQDRLRWYENTAGDGSSWSARTVFPDAVATGEVFAADIDGDDDIDLVVNQWFDTTWWENEEGDGLQWSQHAIDDSHWDSSFEVADLDSDGDADVLAADSAYGLVGWNENLAGDGSAWTWHLLWDSGLWDNTIRVHAADVDGDGDIDVLSAAELQSGVNWYENSAGDGSAWIVRPISGESGEAVAVCTGHVNDDGDLDVLSAGAAEVTWYSRSNLELDDDGDGVADCEGDCNDDDLTVWGLPGEVRDLTLLEDRQTLTWSAPADPGATGLVYNTLRGETPDGFLGATCVEWGDGSDTEAVDTDAPASGAVYYYLVVGVNGCGTGCAGTDSDEDEREVCACP